MAPASYHTEILIPKYEQADKVKLLTPNHGLPFATRWPNLNLNHLNPNIKIQILICYPYTFSIEVVGGIFMKYQLDSSCVIISLILMTTLFYKAVTLQGEI